MARRVLEFPPDAGMPIDIRSLASPVEGSPQLLSVSPTSHQRTVAMDIMLETLTDRASTLDVLSNELLDLVAQYDPVQLILSIAIPTGVAILELDDEDDAPMTYSWDAKIEYLAGLTLTGPPGEDDVDKEVTTKALKLVGSVFDAARAQLFVQSLSDDREHLGIEQARFLLQMEYLVDRMSGYTEHLGRIDEEIFAPHSDLYYEELGFCPSDAIDLVRNCAKWSSIEFSHIDIYNSFLSDDEPQSILHRLESFYKWTPELLSQISRLPIERVRSFLRNMSIDFGCQPDFRVPSDYNKLRYYPLIRIPNDTFLVPAPWSVAHSIHDWLRDYIKHNSSSRLAISYPKHRSSAAERLVHSELKKVFGDKAVLSNQHYDSSRGHGEIDCIVLGNIPILVEVKSNTLSEKGRSGDQSRIGRVIKKVITKPFDQTSRACSYVLDEQGRCFSDRQGQQSRILLPSNIMEAVSIIITLERMDPFAISASELAGEDESKDIWVTNMPDFLMVCDILDDPASFLHYARIRQKICELNIEVYVESDALSGYLENRLKPLIDQIEQSEERCQTILTYNSTIINKYFTMIELGDKITKPSTGVPLILIEALRTCTSDYPYAWVIIASAVMEASPRTWRAWRNFLRKHKNERPFVIPGTEATIIASKSITKAELVDNSVPQLLIPHPDKLVDLLRV